MGRIMDDISKWPIEKRRQYLESLYEKRIGRPLNLENPHSFTEKIQWMKLYDTDDKMTRCVDKLEFKEYVREKIGDGYTAKLYGIWRTKDEVDFESIPTNCVIKSNCSGDGKYVYIIKNKDKYDFSKIEKEIKDECFNRAFLHTNSFFSAYYPVTPCVLIEEDISESVTGEEEYKVFCFNGIPRFIYTSDNHFDEKGNRIDCSISFYDTNWNAVDVVYGDHPKCVNLTKPVFYDEMIQLSSKLAEDFSFVRVDFCVTKKRFYVTELTFAVGGGLTPYYPDEFDYKMGELWKGYPFHKEGE